jgi:hypothetical protein
LFFFIAYCAFKYCYYFSFSARFASLSKLLAANFMSINTSYVVGGGACGFGFG